MQTLASVCLGTGCGGRSKEEGEVGVGGAGRGAPGSERARYAAHTLTCDHVCSALPHLLVGISCLDLAWLVDSSASAPALGLERPPSRSWLALTAWLTGARRAKDERQRHSVLTVCSRAAEPADPRLLVVCLPCLHSQYSSVRYKSMLLLVRCWRRMLTLFILFTKVKFTSHKTHVRCRPSESGARLTTWSWTAKPKRVLTPAPPGSPTDEGR